MATGNVVPGRQDYGTTLIYCWKCGALYSTDSGLETKNGHFTAGRTMVQAYENCPVCGCETNGYDEVIARWQYNLIKWWRRLWNR